ncbi:MAG TPA: NADH-quinone oxidoreductase subunit I, partial [Polyangiaceae bacterium]
MSVTFPKKPSSPTNAVVAEHPEKNLYIQSYFPEVFKGLAVSMKHFFDNTKEMVLGRRPDPVLERFDEGITTISYPEQKRPYPERFRGVHRLTQ